MLISLSAFCIVVRIIYEVTKGQFPQLKVTICNISIETTNFINAIMLRADTNGFIMAKVIK